MVLLTVGKNSYGTLAEADTYLDGSLRAASAWVGIAPDDKRRALITAYRLLERQVFAGDQTGVTIIDLASVSAGGSSYVVGDEITVSGGTAGEAAIVRVTSVSSGVVTGVDLIHAGTYTATPSSPAATTGGSGSGATIALTFTDQISDWPRTDVFDCDGDSVDSTTYPTQLKEAQFELAYSLTQQGDIETAGDTSSNIKKVQAGSVAVEYFRPDPGLARFPSEVQELVACFLDGSNAFTTLAGGLRGGADNESVFDDYPDNFGLAWGY
jgi:hypothetical protein